MGSESDDTELSEGLQKESWYTLSMNGKRVGYVHSYLVRDGDVMRHTTVQWLKIGRLGNEVVMETTNIQEETLDGKPLFFSTEAAMGQVPTRMQGKIEDGIIHLKQIQYGVEIDREIPWPKGALMTWGAYLQTKDLQYAEGVKIEQTLFIPDLSVAKGFLVTSEVVGREEIEWRGEKLNLWKVKSTTHAGSTTVNETMWTDDKTAYRYLMPMGDIVIEMVLSDSAEALTDFAASEMMVGTMLELENVKGVEGAQQVIYKIQVKGDDPTLLDGLFVSNSNQTVLPGRVAGELLLQVHPLRKPEQSESAPSHEYLQPTFYLNYEDEAVQKLVKQVADMQKQPVAERARSLTEWVYNSLEDKNFDTGFATASEVARSMSGDCTEHAVLLAALGRALGIPSRCAYGMALLVEENNDNGWMGFHMWTQFFVDGKWTDYDAALFSLTESPVRLCMGTTSMQKDVLSEFSFQIMQVLGLLNVEVIGVVK
jgi:hypothetical protein